MVSTNDFKTGLTIEYEGNIYQIKIGRASCRERV